MKDSHPINEDEAPIDSSEANKSSVVEKQDIQQQKEVNGRGGLEPTRYGDWEKNGRCVDF